jgi:hypothetical protein
MTLSKYNHKSGSVSQKTHNTFIIKFFIEIIAVSYRTHEFSVKAEYRSFGILNRVVHIFTAAL